MTLKGNVALYPYHSDLPGFQKTHHNACTVNDKTENGIFAILPDSGKYDFHVAIVCPCWYELPLSGYSVFFYVGI